MPFQSDDMHTAAYVTRTGETNQRASPAALIATTATTATTYH